jgi:hypothetical protein
VLTDGLRSARERGLSLERAIEESAELRAHLPGPALRDLLGAPATDATGPAGAMIDAVLTHARGAREQETDEWS